MLYGAILGDIIGSPYEFDRGERVKDFPLFDDNSQFTDDTVMTIAVACALKEVLNEGLDGDRAKLVFGYMMKYLGRAFPGAGYGRSFHQWLRSKEKINLNGYNSYGNGSAMRVSPIGWAFVTMEETLHYAKLSAEITHSHPEGIKGAQAIAAAIFLARDKTYSKSMIERFIKDNFGYTIIPCDDIRKVNKMYESCQETVPVAISAFLEGTSYEDVVRTAVSLGGDTDTIAAMAGSIAEAFYGVPDELKEKAREILSPELVRLVEDFEEFICNRIKGQIMEKNSRKFSPVKWIGCLFRAFLTFARYGVWTMHLYSGDEEVIPINIIVKGKKFRPSASLAHNADEKVYPRGAYITYQCIYCGKKEHAWTDDYIKYMQDNAD